MTNGEKIQQMFPGKCPHIGFNENFGRIWLMQNGEDFANFTLKWWNAEYKEPITKNCESCRYYGLHHEVCKYCYECSLWTQGEPTTKNDLGVDCISRADAIGCLAGQIELSPSNVASVHEYLKCVNKRLLDLPSVTPQEPKTGHCKDCKWWKDSDGAYRRGIRAESQCPINRKEVYEGNGYCFLYEPQESEDAE